MNDVPSLIDFMLKHCKDVRWDIVGRAMRILALDKMNKNLIVPQYDFPLEKVQYPFTFISSSSEYIGETGAEDIQPDHIVCTKSQNIDQTL